MRVLVIGKPNYNVILPIEKFIAETSKNQINDKIEVVGGTSIYTSLLLKKWGIDNYYTGIIGSDIYGNKIKTQLEESGVDTKFIEINYEHPTSMNYILLNKTNASSTQIINNNPEINLTKFKYDFVPDIIIMDGTDTAGSHAALNNFPKAISVLFANKVSESLYDISKKCTYVVANVDYARALSKMDIEINKPKALVNLMQRIKDLNKAHYTIMLREHGVIYISDNQVKMIPAIKIDKKIDDTNSGSVFFSAFCYGLINKYSIDNTVKIANIAAGLSLKNIGTLNALPDLAEVLNLAGLTEVAKTEETSAVEQETLASEPQTEQTSVVTPNVESAPVANIPVQNAEVSQASNEQIPIQNVSNIETLNIPSSESSINQ